MMHPQVSRAPSFPYSSHTINKLFTIHVALERVLYVPFRSIAA
jgi:hypothetical protein